jgi:hypothetical protein
MPTITPEVTVEVDSAVSSFSTVSLLQPTAFKITIDRQHYANIEFFAQSVLHPAMSMSAVEVPYSRVSVPMPGDKLTFGEVTAIVIIDEDLNGYTEMYNWMKRLVETTYQSAMDRTQSNPPSVADITVSVLSSHNNTTRKLVYRDCVPTLLGDISFEATSGDVQYLTFPVSFRFSYFDIV